MITLQLKFTVRIGVLALLLLGVSCAQQRAPMGGPKDEDPPKILRSEPQNLSLNYHGGQIIFEFDEYVRVSGANQKLIVTPPLKYPVEFKMKRKTVTVMWSDTLLDSATYMFQFGEGIVDVNESNPLDSNIFVFSTGDYIDSFEMGGKVIDAFTLKPVKDVWVMLYPTNKDSLPYKELPRYFAKTDELGEYKLQYLAPGKYKVFALQPVNAGYKFDQPDEAIAFSDQMVSVFAKGDTNAVDLPNLRLFTQKDTLQFIKEFGQIDNMGLSFRFNNRVDSIVLDELSGMEISNWTPEWNAYNDSVVYWFVEPMDYDSIKLKVEVDGFIDTLFFRKPTSNTRRGKEKSKSADKLTLTPSAKGQVNHFSDFKLTFSTPLAAVDLSNALLVEANDSLSLTDHVTQNNNELVVSRKWKEGAKYQIFIPDSSIKDRFDRYNDTVLINLTATRKEDFGELIIKFDLPDYQHPYIWQLQKADGKLVKEQFVDPTGSITYPHLAAGKYKVKILFDRNGNQLWDSGNYLKKQQPERVEFYDQSIEIRGNWTNELEWILNDPE